MLTSSKIRVFISYARADYDTVLREGSVGAQPVAPDDNNGRKGNVGTIPALSVTDHADSTGAVPTMTSPLGDRGLSLLRSALLLSNHVLEADKNALAHQLVGRGDLRSLSPLLPTKCGSKRLGDEGFVFCAPT
jgi:hypothetical protein